MEPDLRERLREMDEHLCGILGVLEEMQPVLARIAAVLSPREPLADPPSTAPSPAA